MSETSRKNPRKSKLVPTTYVDVPVEEDKELAEVQAPLKCANASDKIEFSVDIEVEEFDDGWVAELDKEKEKQRKKSTETSQPAETAKKNAPDKNSGFTIIVPPNINKYKRKYAARSTQRPNRDEPRCQKHRKVAFYILEKDAVAAVDRTVLTKGYDVNVHMITVMHQAILESPYVDLKGHIATDESVPDLSRYRCNECNGVFYTFAMFKLHMTDYHVGKSLFSFVVTPKNGVLELQASLQCRVLLQENCHLGCTTYGPLMLFCKSYEYAIWTIYMRWNSENFCNKGFALLTYKCYSCHELFQSYLSFLEHLNANHSEHKLYISSEVMMNTVDSYLAIIASERMQPAFQDLTGEEKEYKCPKCQVTTGDLKTHTKHMSTLMRCTGCCTTMTCDKLKIHEGFCKQYLESFYPKMCPCRKVFSTPQEMDEHQKGCSFGRTTLAFHCQVCKYLAPSPSRLYAHQRAEHSVRSDTFAAINKVYKCEMCKENFNMEKKWHKCDPRHRCDHCLLHVASQFYNDLQHDIQKSGVKCDYCHVICKTQCAMTMHTHSYHGIALVYRCTVCSIEFNTEETKDKHVENTQKPELSARASRGNMTVQEHRDNIILILKKPKRDSSTQVSIDDENKEICEEEKQPEVNKEDEVVGDDTAELMITEEEEVCNINTLKERVIRDDAEDSNTEETPSTSQQNVVVKEEKDWESVPDDNELEGTEDVGVETVNVKTEPGIQINIKDEPLEEYLGEGCSKDYIQIEVKEEHEIDVNDLNNVFRVSKDIMENSNSYQVKDEPEDDEEDLVVTVFDQNDDPESIENFIRMNPEITLNELRRPPKVYNCKRCDFSGLYTPMKMHMSTCKKPMPHKTLLQYKCIMCGDRFDDLRQYLRHLETGHGFAATECPCCRMRDIEPRQMPQHILTHIKNSFRKVNLINSLTSDQTQNKQFKCVSCKSIMTEDAFFVHWQTHFSNDKATKVYSGKKPAPETDTSAQKTHTEVFRNDYTHVPSTSNNKQLKIDTAMLGRIIDILKSPKVKEKDCIVCGKTFIRNGDYKRHIIEHLVMDAYATKFEYAGFKCQICNEVNVKVDKYKRHMREHALLPLYQCQICDRSFSDSSNFGKHKKVHNLFVLACELCSRKFQCEATLQKHMRDHSKYQIINCDKCDKTFYFPSSYRKHYHSAHNEMQVYRCKICKATFPSIREKWDHEWDVHKERKQEADCPICKISFRKFTDAKIHIKKMHGILVEKSNYKFVKLMDTMKKLDMSVDDLETLIDKRKSVGSDLDDSD